MLRLRLTAADTNPRAVADGVTKDSVLVAGDERHCVSFPAGWPSRYVYTVPLEITLSSLNVKIK